MVGFPMVPPKKAFGGRHRRSSSSPTTPRRFAAGAGGLGDRLTESIDGVTMVFLLDINPSVPSGQATGLTQVLADNTYIYLYGLGRIAQVTGEESVYFLGDPRGFASRAGALGSVRLLTDGEGIVVLAQSYEPYGSVLNTASEDVTKYGFTGEWQENGLVFLRARYYGSDFGIFTSSDIWNGDEFHPLSFNEFIYAETNPIMFMDPQGTYCIEEGPGLPGFKWNRRTCGYDSIDPTVDIKNYDDTIPPKGITFVGRELINPPFIEIGDCIDSNNVEQCMRKFHKPGDLRWQVINGHGNLCGQMSVWTVLKGFGADVSPFDVIEEFKGIFSPRNEEDYLTDGQELAILVNRSFSRYAHEALEQWVKWTYVGDWANNDYGILQRLHDDWFSWGTYVLAMIRCDFGYGGLGRLSFGITDEEFTKGGFGPEPRERFSGQYGKKHWVVITGVSSQWNWPTTNKWFNPWQWVRVFNPWRGMSEYYWARDFSRSWWNLMLRMDPSESPHACTLQGEWGECVPKG
jgi:RHS repeat-associated protein